MDSLTLPRIDAAIPLEIQSAKADLALISELQRRCDRRQVVRARRQPTATAAMAATLKALFNPRGGQSERFLHLVLVLDEEAYTEESSSFHEGEVAWSIYPAQDMQWVYIGRAIAHLEQLHPGLGETVLHAIGNAADAVDGVVNADTVRGLSSMMYWDDAQDDARALDSLEERGYSTEGDDDRPLLPSELEREAGGTMWMKPHKRLSQRSLQQALGALGNADLARLAKLVGTDLPRASRTCMQLRRTMGFEAGYYSFALGIWHSEQHDGHAQRLIDDVTQDRMNSGETDVLFRCSTEPPVDTKPAPRRGGTPNTGDGLAFVANQLRVYHLLDQTLGVLVDLQNSLPHGGQGNNDANCLDG